MRMEFSPESGSFVGDILPKQVEPRHSAATIAQPDRHPFVLSGYLSRFLLLSVGSVMLAIATDLWLRYWAPETSLWLVGLILIGVTLPLLGWGARHFVRQARLQENALRRQDARQRRLARRDRLTQADNRLAFEEHVALLNQDPSGKPSALFVLDVYDFQRINDACGHDVGDEVLRETCQRLRALLATHAKSSKVRSGGGRSLQPARVIRVGSDELALWLPEWTVATDAQQVAQDILNTLDKPFRFKGLNLHIRGNVGYAIDGTRQLDSSQWLSRANLATQHAKRLGPGHTAAFSSEQAQAMVRRHTLLEALQESLESGEGLSLEYQPLVSLELRTLMGCEALLRWKHPVLGSIAPSEFIPVAEGSDLIHPLGRWVLREAVEQLAVWQSTVPVAAMLRMKVSVNLSRIQLLDSKLVTCLAELLQQHRVPASALRLEVTESEPLDDPECLQTLNQLRQLGVSLALDDFGTGYSSLSAMLNLPIRSVKIDRHFVAGIDTCPYRQALVAGVLRVAEAMGLDVVAEGVEREEEASVLTTMGCHHMQGWLVSRSLPAVEFARQWLQVAGPMPAVMPDSTHGCQASACELAQFEQCPRAGTADALTY